MVTPLFLLMCVATQPVFAEHFQSGILRSSSAILSTSIINEINRAGSVDHVLASLSSVSTILTAGSAVPSPFAQSTLSVLTIVTPTPSVTPAPVHPPAPRRTSDWEYTTITLIPASTPAPSSSPVLPGRESLRTLPSESDAIRPEVASEISLLDRTVDDTLYRGQNPRGTYSHETVNSQVIRNDSVLPEPPESSEQDNSTPGPHTSASITVVLSAHLGVGTSNATQSNSTTSHKRPWDWDDRPDSPVGRVWKRYREGSGSSSSALPPNRRRVEEDWDFAEDEAFEQKPSHRRMASIFASLLCLLSPRPEHWSRKRKQKLTTAPDPPIPEEFSRRWWSLQRDSQNEINYQPETWPISQEQLVAEAKGIYAGLIMAEAKCLEHENETSPFVPSALGPAEPVLNNEQWQALIAQHRILLHEHHDFFLAFQHLSASPALGRLATKYAMPAKMWRHGIHSFFELLGHRLPESLDHLLAFINFAHYMMALQCESEPAFNDIWVECLEDLGHYRMATGDDDSREREVWTGVSRNWYNEASERTPMTGRLYHHLATLARPNALQQLFYYRDPLNVAVPFRSVRESILTLFEPLILANCTRSRSNRRLPLGATVETMDETPAAGSSFDHDSQVAFTRMLEEQISRVTQRFLEQSLIRETTSSDSHGLSNWFPDSDMEEGEELLLSPKPTFKSQPSLGADEELSNVSLSHRQPSPSRILPVAERCVKDKISREDMGIDSRFDIDCLFEMDWTRSDGTKFHIPEISTPEKINGASFNSGLTEESGENLACSHSNSGYTSPHDMSARLESSTSGLDEQGQDSSPASILLDGAIDPNMPALNVSHHSFLGSEEPFLQQGSLNSMSASFSSSFYFEENSPGTPNYHALIQDVFIADWANAVQRPQSAESVPEFSLGSSLFNDPQDQGTYFDELPFVNGTDSWMYDDFYFQSSIKESGPSSIDSPMTFAMPKVSRGSGIIKPDIITVFQNASSTSPAELDSTSSKGRHVQWIEVDPHPNTSSASPESVQFTKRSKHDTKCFACPDCKKEFRRQCDLNKHKAAHTRPFRCTVQCCDDAFPSNKDLARHMRDRHEVGNERFVCRHPDCAGEIVSFKRSDGRRKHWRKSHGRNPAPDEEF